MWQILGKEDKMKKFNLKKLTVTAILAAVAVVGSLFSFPVFGSKCAPVQHLVNILCAVTVGPWWALAQAFIAALIRNLLGLGSPLAFPGSMCGALLGGLLYKYGKKLPFAYIGESLVECSLIRWHILSWVIKQRRYSHLLFRF